MNRLQKITLVTLALFNFSAAAFAWGRYNETSDYSPQTPHVTQGVSPSKPANIAFVLDDEIATTSRPLFEKTRRPDDGSIETHNGAPPGGIKLLAITLSPRLTSAFITSTTTPNGKWIKVGEIFEAWTLDSISPRTISLRQGAALTQLSIDYIAPASPGVSDSEEAARNSRQGQ